MNQNEQTAAFEKDLNRLVERYASEFELTYASIIGTLMLKVHELAAHGQKMRDDEQDDPPLH